ncbi:YkvA family protein [Cognatilysobacter bugurensis]|uniref:Membrane protein n=1 Tax=Cognatilysobacter bugurensis TaxID=543356 RepID=A0A918T0D9_9GAMM|nr:DUF1232 domain-containing protein [Lysobacter bugurensis]GHA80472.1 membrane protein [Lysobacter bugurensis]
MALSTLRRWARGLKQQALVVYFAARDPRTPWPVRLLALTVAAYALSPIDLIPDFIPVLGLLDDLVLVPLGVWLVLRWMPLDVARDARERAQVAAERPVSRGTAAVVVLVWLLAAALVTAWAWRAWNA